MVVESGAHWRYRGRESPGPQSSDGHFDFFALAGSENLVDCGEQFALPNCFHERAAISHCAHRGLYGCAARFEIENLREGAIVKNCALFAADHGDSFDHAFQNRGGTVAFIGEGSKTLRETRGSFIHRAGQRG